MYIAIVETRTTGGVLICPYGELGQELRDQTTFYLGVSGYWQKFRDGGLDPGLSAYFEDYEPVQPALFESKEEALQRAQDWADSLAPDFMGAEMKAGVKLASEVPGVRLHASV